MGNSFLGNNFGVFVELVACGRFDPLEFSELSGLKPTHIARKGSRRRDGDVCVPPRDVWTHKGELLLSDDYARVEEALEIFIQFLVPFEHALVEACRKLEVELHVDVLVKFSFSEALPLPSFFLCPTHVGFLCALNAGFDINLQALESCDIV